MIYRQIISQYAKVFGLSYYEAIYHASIVGLPALVAELSCKDEEGNEGYVAETGEECYSALRSSGATIKI